jgi:hypothetical protein
LIDCEPVIAGKILVYQAIFCLTTIQFENSMPETRKRIQGSTKRKGILNAADERFFKINERWNLDHA